jgi:hypothetical protein
VTEDSDFGKGVPSLLPLLRFFSSSQIFCDEIFTPAIYRNLKVMLQAIYWFPSFFMINFLDFGYW